MHVPEESEGFVTLGEWDVPRQKRLTLCQNGLKAYEEVVGPSVNFTLYDRVADIIELKKKSEMCQLFKSH